MGWRGIYAERGLAGVLGGGHGGQRLHAGREVAPDRGEGVESVGGGNAVTGDLRGLGICATRRALRIILRRGLRGIVAVVILGRDPGHAHEAVAARIGDGRAIALHVVFLHDQRHPAAQRLATLVQQHRFDIAPLGVVNGGLHNGDTVAVERRKAGVHDGPEVSIFAAKRRVGVLLQRLAHLGLRLGEGASERRRGGLHSPVHHSASSFAQMPIRPPAAIHSETAIGDPQQPRGASL